MKRLARQCARTARRTMWAAPLFICSIALAQAAAPTPTANKASPAWLGYLIVFILVAAVVTVSLMPSKRGHQE